MVAELVTGAGLELMAFNHPARDDLDAVKSISLIFTIAPLLTSSKGGIDPVGVAVKSS